MAGITFLSSNAVERLTDDAGNNLDWYYSLANESAVCPLVQKGDLRFSSLEVESLRNKLIVSENVNTQYAHDAKNSKIVYTALQQLTPHQATDERLWVYLCHTECKNYTTRRWLSSKPPTEKSKTEIEISHFFIPSSGKQRHLLRSNAVSRLWWMGYIASQINPENPDLILEIMLHGQDVAVQILTRSWTSNKRLLIAIFNVLRIDWQGNKKLLKRDVFRNWMARINFYGGVALLDTLPDQVMEAKIKKFADEALRTSESD